MGRIPNAEALIDYGEHLRKACPAASKMVTVCMGTGCQVNNAAQVYQAFRDIWEEQGEDAEWIVRPTGCHGFCERGVLVVIQPAGIFYQHVKPGDVAEIFEASVRGGRVLERLIYVDPQTQKTVAKVNDIPFYKHQQRVILKNNGHIDPTAIDAYIAAGGYRGLLKAFDMGPAAVLDEINASNLRGRGGGGYPAGRKWEICKNTRADKRYVICNADEGDPGAFMDRSLLEGNPHAVIEGMIIGAYTIGSDEGYVYIRNEYPLAVERLSLALSQAREKGLLGTNILETGFRFDIHVSRGGGAFVCGESTALMASIEGKVGEPRAKHIHTAIEGLWGKPTTLNNVETWANVPVIIDKGAAWYTTMGTKGSTGTKIFSLVGKVNNTGLVEVPMGTTLREIIFDIGGGIPGGKAFKAVQTGGPSGGCLGAEALDVPVDFDRLTQAGAMMGSGGMIVMDETTCMVDVSRYFLDFLKSESCGKCTTCREGLIHLHQLVQNICEGRGTEKSLQLIEDLSETIAVGSLCGLGKTAVNPVRSALKHFREEFLTHINARKCPAGVCKALLTYTIDAEKCNGCTACLKVCPQGAVVGEKKEVHRIRPTRCIKCGLCFEACQFDAVKVN